MMQIFALCVLMDMEFPLVVLAFNAEILCAKNANLLKINLILVNNALKNKKATILMQKKINNYKYVIVLKATTKI